MVTSRREGSCGRRPITKTSKIKIADVTRMVVHQTRGVTSMRRTYPGPKPWQESAIFSGTAERHAQRRQPFLAAVERGQHPHAVGGEGEGVLEVRGPRA